jgi:hypothetical protein
MSKVNDKSYIAGDQNEQYWRREIPNRRSCKMQLLTIGGVCVLGHWVGELNQYYTAWAPLLKDSR